MLSVVSLGGRGRVRKIRNLALSGRFTRDGVFCRRGRKPLLFLECLPPHDEPVMERTLDYFDERKKKASRIYSTEKSIYNPYFKSRILLDSEGFRHLQFSAGRERSKREQLLRFSLLPLALDTIRKAGTIQEYRKVLAPIGRKRRDGFRQMKEVEYWGLVAIVGEKRIKIRTILRKVEGESITFWSVMPYQKIKSGHQKLYRDGIEGG